MASYLTQSEAELRLSSRFGIGASVLPGHVEAASGRLDDLGPFVGATYTFPQALAFPRSVTLAGDVEGVVPDLVKDWVALTASEVSVEDVAPVSSMSADGVSVAFARPTQPTSERLKSSLISKYQRKTGTLG